MEQRYQNVTLQELAHFFHYSERHMIRLLKEYTGQSFSQNIQKIKLKHAAELLITTDLSQKQIASRVGYSNPNHLKKLFIQQYQMTPAEYRALNKEI
jgi:AraC family transcriptional activator of pobA